jgi:uncharacterized membrane protein
MNAHPLWGYVVAVVVVMVVIVGVMHFFYPERQREVFWHCVSFLFGMLAMYIAVHIYSWR